MILQSTAHVEGEVLHKDLAMEQEAYFEGESRRSEDPLSAAEEPTLGDQTAAKPHGSVAKAEKTKRRRLLCVLCRSWIACDNTTNLRRSRLRQISSGAGEKRSSLQQSFYN